MKIDTKELLYELAESIIDILDENEELKIENDKLKVRLKSLCSAEAKEENKENEQYFKN